MSDVIPGTLVHMRTVRRFAHYMAGELIAVPFDAARDLHARRLAEPLQLFVPAGPAVATATEDGSEAPATPQRQPGGVVRK
jgi:hypothetical protein